MKNHQSLQQTLLNIRKILNREYIEVADIVKYLSGNGKFLILIFLSLPFCLPIPMPGISSIFGIIVAFIGIRITFGKNIWIPNFLLRKKIDAHKIDKITKKGLSLIDRLKKVIHVRYTHIFRYRYLKAFNGLVLCFLGIFLALPIPLPITNMIAAWAILCISIGVLEEDGLFLFIGYLITLVIILLCVLIFQTIKIATS